MLTLKDIQKDYEVGGNTVPALRGVSLSFRKSEFVSILGQSGCGKTTLLNIVGGLDRYTSGDLIINGKSTKKFKESDWNTYRNHSIGFVFQSYNLIPHQTVLANVELALTLAGISKSERRRRAVKALNEVGLADQLNKKPNQMSGGQMQRVAIARALVNDPDILLADEPTGALDSETSLQIMELLKEIARDKLVIMVTHNPDLAEQYSTRIIRLLDGKVTDDSDPYEGDDAEAMGTQAAKRHSMSFFTALSLSLNNLMTKKARTFLTSFAGSIGIIGIALILALSSGVDAYIAKVEEDTLTSYPLTLEKNTMDISEFISGMMGSRDSAEEVQEGTLVSNNIMTDMITTMVNGMTSNNLANFKTYLETEKTEIMDYVSDIQYGYSTEMNIYTEDGDQINPSTVFQKLGMDSSGQDGSPQMGMSFTNANIWTELLENDELLEKQYDVIAGRMPENNREIVLIVGENNEISDFTLYTLGLKDSDELEEMMKKAIAGEKLEKTDVTTYSYDEILSLKFKLLVNTDYFTQNEDGTWTDNRDDEVFLLEALKSADDIRVVGILRPSEESTVSASGGVVGYLSGLMTELIEQINASEIVRKQQETPDIDVLTGLPFSNGEEKTMEDIQAYLASLPEEEQAQMNAYIDQMRTLGLTDEKIAERLSAAIWTESSSTLEENLALFGVSDLDDPSEILLYPKDFESKETLTHMIAEYNEGKEEADQINYTDYIGIMLRSVSTIINAISYILIAFVSISLVVSSIMIGIITYISVLERTKEIGILRAMGASRRDISRVFNAETLIVGFVAGAIGIGVTLLLILPINAVIKAITDIGGLAVLPLKGGLILVLISMLLTFISGLIPARVAAKKDPVIALRTE